MLGQNAAAHPDVVRAVAAAGHEIGNHTWSHPNLASLSETAVRRELSRTQTLLASLTGRAPTVFRAPYGNWSAATLRVCAELGLRPIAWSVDPRDWSRPGVGVIVEVILRRTSAGSIILTHDGGGDRSQTVAALDLALPKLSAEGLRFIEV